MKYNYAGMTKTFKKVTAETMPMPYSANPSFTIPTDNLPQAKSWQVGKTYQLAVEVVQKNVDMHRGVTFEIKKIRPLWNLKKLKNLIRVYSN